MATVTLRDRTCAGRALSNACLVLIGERQIADLDELMACDAWRAVVLRRLGPLAGG